MKYKAILFDMDGTLVPMDTETFANGYFVGLYKKLAHFGVDSKVIVDAIWKGTAAMVKNDGSRPNGDVFWEIFPKLTGISREEGDPICIDFYSGDFNAAKAFTGENPLAAEAVKTARSKAEKVILSTNPIFPMVGQITRMSWVGLKPEDFDLVTSYESDCYCKPNPKYYDSIFERTGVKPEECLLIGNDETEDMYAGSQAGLNCYLVTDCLIPSKKHPWTGPRGTFKEMLEMLKNL